MHPQIHIVGQTGTHCSGKGLTADFLINKGFRHFSARDFLRKEIMKRGLPLTDRDQYNIVANQLRREEGAPIVGYSLYMMAHAAQASSVIESLYLPEEVTAIKAALSSYERFVLISVDADLDIRASRYEARASDTDGVSKARFIEQQRRELVANSPNEHNLRACMDMANIKLTNNGTPEEYYSKLESELRSHGIL